MRELSSFIPIRLGVELNPLQVKVVHWLLGICSAILYRFKMFTDRSLSSQELAFLRILLFYELNNPLIIQQAQNDTFLFQRFCVFTLTIPQMY